ncbi:hypothetical protein B296_00020478 [Ensete ventricosum]|uniref:Uncharacterized protein n=1 Tax=Ensete ventricosum TaxID=4639 RepID=A0A426Z1F1_ENSVE|nr:hypothetical protein B296_00020478 [Ensete ventricosum]
MEKILHVFCIGTADTKLEELRFLADVLRSRLATYSNDSPTFKVLRSAMSVRRSGLRSGESSVFRILISLIDFWYDTIVAMR